MKTGLCIISAAVTMLSFSSFTASNEESKTKQIVITSPFKKIKVDENIKVVLVPAGSVATASVSGNAVLVEQTHIDVYRNQLIVSSDREVRSEDDLTVYIPVGELSEINLANGAEISARGELHFDKLEVLVNVGSKVNLQVGGKVEMIPASDCEFVYVKKGK